MKINYWIYLIAFILIALIVGLPFELLIRSESNYIFYISMLISYGIVDYWYRRIEFKEKSIPKSLRHMTAILIIVSLLGILSLPFFLYANLSDNFWQAVYEILLLYLVIFIIAYLTTLIFSIKHKTKFMTELSNILKFK